MQSTKRDDKEAKHGRHSATTTTKMSRSLSLLIGRSSKFKLTAAGAVAAFASLLLIMVSSLVILNRQFSYLSTFSPPQRVYDPSCDSRHNSYHRRTSSLQPSPYFLSKLKQYENLHSRCGPLSESFNQSDCKYVVYTPSRGLGNRILSLASTFLYALLTDRVLLVEFGPDMERLFCEPFRSSTWFLPETFPLRHQFYKPEFREVYSYGNLLKKKEQQQQNNTKEQQGSSSIPFNNSSPSVVQLFLHDQYNDYDKLFFKDENQRFLQRVPWLVLISTGYFVPSLFQMDSQRAELGRLFPGDDGVETVFHHLGNYLFSPSNQAWKLITAFYESHLAKADERIGFQIRVFEPKKTPPPLVMKQIFACTENRKLLPSTRNQSRSILVASLSSQFHDEIKSRFGGGNTGVYQASHEEKQVSGNDSHNMKAWVDMYLLSMSDVLVTSSFSTFGYVAAGLGGIRPWIVMFPRDFVKKESELPEPACERAVNMEPCFHVPPWFAYPDQPGTVGPVKRCEDVPWGLKLVAGHH